MKRTFEDWLNTEYRPVAGGAEVVDRREADPAPAAEPAAGDAPAGGEGAAAPAAAPDALMGRMDEVLNSVRELANGQGAAQPQPAPGYDPNDPYGLGADPTLQGMQDMYFPGQQPQQPQPGQIPGQMPGMAPPQVAPPGYPQPGQMPAQPGYPGQPDPFGGQQLTPDQMALAALQQGQAQGVDPALIQQAVQQAVAPVAQRQELMRREQEAQGLLEDYPELKDEATAQRVTAESRQWAQDVGLPQLAGEPAFVELVHLALKASARGESEIPAGSGEQQPVSLEQPGGGPASGEQQQPRLADQVKAAGNRNSFWMG